MIETLSLISGQAMTLNQSLNWSRGGEVIYETLIEAENAEKVLCQPRVFHCVIVEALKAGSPEFEFQLCPFFSDTLLDLSP